MTFDECFKKACAEIAAVYGPALNFSSKSPDGQLALTIALSYYEIEEMKKILECGVCTLERRCPDHGPSLIDIGVRE